MFSTTPPTFKVRQIVRNKEYKSAITYMTSFSKRWQSSNKSHALQRSVFLAWSAFVEDFSVASVPARCGRSELFLGVGAPVAVQNIRDGLP